VPGTTVVSASEQIVLRPGGPLPPHPRRLGREEIAKLAGCQVDFHGTASNVASHERKLQSAERIATSEPDLEIWTVPGRSPASIGDAVEVPAEPCSAADCPGAGWNAAPRSLGEQNPRVTDGF
jgi:hypothetical protein